MDEDGNRKGRCAGVGAVAYASYSIFKFYKKGKSKITREMLRRIWSDPGNVSDSVLDVVAEEFSNKFEVCNINTKNRLYHFFA